MSTKAKNAHVRGEHNQTHQLPHPCLCRSLRHIQRCCAHRHCDRQLEGTALSCIAPIEWPVFSGFLKVSKESKKDLDAPSQYGGACSEAYKLSTALFVREVLSRTDKLAGPMLFFVSHCFPLKFSLRLEVCRRF